MHVKKIFNINKVNMKTDKNSTVTEYPEIVGKTVKNVKNVQKDGISIIIGFTDGSTFIASPKPLPNTKYSLEMHETVRLSGETEIIQAHLVSLEPWNDPREPETDSVIIASSLRLHAQTYYHDFNIMAYTSVAQTVQLDTKLIPASTN